MIDSNNCQPSSIEVLQTARLHDLIATTRRYMLLYARHFMPRKFNKEDRALRLQTAFRPSTPINSMELFAGRRRQSEAILAATNQNGRHVILFGERGVGKTSLANVLCFLIQSPGWPKVTPVANCARNDSYGVLWGRVFNEITRTLEKMDESGQPIDLTRECRRLLRLSSESFFEAITMDSVKAVLSEIGTKTLLVIVLDEFDRLENDEVRQEVADTIKYLSDRNVPCTLVIVGVSDNVDGLIADHQSIERCLAQVNMPRMSRGELEEIVMKCLPRVGMEADDSALQEISRISCGLPHYAHLIGQYAGLKANEADETTVTSTHVFGSLPVATENSHQTVKSAYIRATESSQKTAKYREVLAACALATTNELGYFSPTDAREPLTMILRKPARIEAFARHLHTFCSEDGGPVLNRVEIKGHPQFRFINPLMQPYILLRALSEGLITEADLKATRDPNDPQKRLF